MIIGSVNAFREAVITLELHGAAGYTETVDATIDTGYNGYLSVTPAIVARLQFPFREIRTYELGSGDLFDFAIHDASILWDGQLQVSACLVTDGGVLVGMSMLSGYTLFIDAIDGGVVRIEARP